MPKNLIHTVVVFLIRQCDRSVQMLKKKLNWNENDSAGVIPPPEKSAPAVEESIRVRTMECVTSAVYKVEIYVLKPVEMSTFEYRVQFSGPRLLSFFAGFKYVRF